MSVTVTYRKDRKRYQVEYNFEGIRKRPLFREKLEADNFARKIRLGLSPENRDSITVAEAAKQYFDRVSEKKNPKSKSNDRRYLNLQEHFMFTERGIERIGSVQLEDMEAFRDWLPVQVEYDDKPMKMGPSTVNRCLRVIKHFYKRHVQWKNIPENPCFYLEFLDSLDNERPAMSADQYLKTLEKCEDWFKPIVQFAFLTGAPPTCIERLTWADVDLSSRVYSVIRKKGSKARSRRIPLVMSEHTFTLLAHMRNTSPASAVEVFRDESGRRMLADRISRTANVAVRAAGIKGVTFYGLRHALASDMTTAGIATEIVRQAMGHMSMSTTQRYANKVHLKAISGALETVRGGKVVASGEN